MRKILITIFFMLIGGLTFAQAILDYQNRYAADLQEHLNIKQRDFFLFNDMNYCNQEIAILNSAVVQNAVTQEYQALQAQTTTLQTNTSTAQANGT